MSYKKRLFEIIRRLHVSEKVSTEIKKNNTIVLEVAKYSTKPEIKFVVKKIFNVEVENVTTLIVKGKIKKNNQKKYCRSNWKKAYVTLKKGENIDFIVEKE